MSQLLDAFGLLDFTLLRPVLAWGALNRLFIKFSNIYSGRGKPRITEPADTE
jgi:hypothetical protein